MADIQYERVIRLSSLFAAAGLTALGLFFGFASASSYGLLLTLAIGCSMGSCALAIRLWKRTSAKAIYIVIVCLIAINCLNLAQAIDRALK